jgi:hypothetical protein
MSPATRNGLGALGAGLALGVTADVLLDVQPWGLNLFICVAALVAAGYWMVRRSERAPAPDAAWLALTALLLGAAYLRRDAEGLQFLDFVALIGVSALAALAARGVSVRGKEVGEYVVAFLTSARDAWIGAPIAVANVEWSELPYRGRLGRVRGILLGAVIATPLLVLFGSLFAGADPVFSQTVKGIFDFDLERVMGHTLRTGILAWFAAGYLRGLVTDTPLLNLPQRKAESSNASSDRVVPTVTVLVLVDALFLLFVIVQLRYFFGGSGRVQEIADLTYAEYARRGFFELLAASALVVPLLLGAEWAVRGAALAALRRFRIAAVTMLGLLAVVVASALQRMRLYVDAYGFTADRLYATAIMIYLVIALAWLGWTVLRGASRRFAFGAVVQALSVLAGLHILNPDAFIARYNLERPVAERPFDAKYAATLSADAAPVLLDALPRLNPADACVAARRLAAWAATDPDWRTWNWSRARAKALGGQPAVTHLLTTCPTDSK